ncbi:MAG TPA: type II toxin-antitoxin system RelE/ParE family toxin [Xanthobacteraceae bacterium]
MRLRYTRPALADLASILDYIALRSPRGAARVHARIQTITKLLLQFPQAGRVTDDPTIRRIDSVSVSCLLWNCRRGDRDPRCTARCAGSVGPSGLEPILIPIQPHRIVD